MMNRHQGDIFLQYQKGELSREEATDKIICHALKSQRRLFKQDNDDDVRAAAGEKIYKGKNLGMKNFLIPVMYGHLKIDVIRKKIQTDKVLDLIANTTPTVVQQAQTPTVAQQADMHNLRTTAERKQTKRFTPSTYHQKKTKKKNKNGSEKRNRRKIRQAESEKEKDKI